jgi:hypothetical protein
MLNSNAFTIILVNTYSRLMDCQCSVVHVLLHADSAQYILLLFKHTTRLCGMWATQTPSVFLIIALHDLISRLVVHDASLYFSNSHAMKSMSYTKSSLHQLHNNYKLLLVCCIITEGQLTLFNPASLYSNAVKKAEFLQHWRACTFPTTLLNPAVKELLESYVITVNKLMLLSHFIIRTSNC